MKIRTKKLFIMAIGLMIAGAGITAATIGGAKAFAKTPTWTTGPFYSNAQVNNFLSNGVKTAGAWDKECRDVLWSYTNGSAYKSNYYNTASSQYRNLINGNISGYNAASYKSDTWLSARGSGNATAGVSVSYGSKSVELDINYVMFICGTLVYPDFSGSPDANPVTIGTLAGQSYRWATSTWANDRPPNETDNFAMKPALTGAKTRISSLTVTGGSAGSKITNYSSGDTLSVGRDSRTRYWVSPRSGITYDNPSGFTQDVTLKIVMKYRSANGYTGDVWRCVSTDSGNVTIANPYQSNYSTTWARCLEQTKTLTLTLHVSEPARLTPSVDLTSESGSNVLGINERWNAVARTSNSGIATGSANYQWTSWYDLNGDSTWQANEGYIYNPLAGGVSVGANATTTHNPNPRFGNTNPPSGATQVCTALFLNNPGAGTTIAQPSDTACLPIGKTPKAQVWGGDIRTGAASASLGYGYNPDAKIIGLTSSANGKTYGSWSEYALMAPNAINAAGSAAGLAGGVSSNNQADWSNYTFADTTTEPADSFGYFSGGSGLGEMPDIRSYLTSGLKGIDLEENNSSGLIAQSGGYGGYATNGEINVGNDSRVLYIHNGNDLLITNNIINEFSGKNLSNMPQLVIIVDGNIDILSSVTKIDAWLIATGSINTCVNGNGDSEDLHGTVCGEKLNINGPIQANQLFLRRTAGSDTVDTLNDPAEIINLRGDAYLWLRGIVQKNSGIHTTSVQEMSPRY